MRRTCSILSRGAGARLATFGFLSKPVLDVISMSLSLDVIADLVTVAIGFPGEPAHD
jgi:hypothetical protein